MFQEDTELICVYVYALLIFIRWTVFKASLDAVITMQRFDFKTVS